MNISQTYVEGLHWHFTPLGDEVETKLILLVGHSIVIDGMLKEGLA